MKRSSAFSLSQFCCLCYLDSPGTNYAKSANRVKNGATVGRRLMATRRTMSVQQGHRVSAFLAHKRHQTMKSVFCFVFFALCKRMHTPLDGPRCPAGSSSGWLTGWHHLAPSLVCTAGRSFHSGCCSGPSPPGPPGWPCPKCCGSWRPLGERRRGREELKKNNNKKKKEMEDEEGTWTQRN